MRLEEGKTDEFEKNQKNVKKVLTSGMWCDKIQHVADEQQQTNE